MPPKPPPKQITSFKQIDITKLDVKDLQNINYQKLLKDAGQRPDTAISFIIPLIALLFCFSMFTKAQSEQKKMSSRITSMKEKVQLLSEYTAAQTEFDTFTKSLPQKITENEFIDIVTNLAVKNQIQIESYIPGQNKNDPVSDLINISLVASTKDYANMGKFIQDIENTGLAIRINNWSGNLSAGKQGQYRQNTLNSNINDLFINFRMDISSITFKL